MTTKLIANRHYDQPSSETIDRVKLLWTEDDNKEIITAIRLRDWPFLANIFMFIANKCSYCHTKTKIIDIYYKKPVPDGARDLKITMERSGYAVWCPECEAIEKIVYSDGFSDF